MLIYILEVKTIVDLLASAKRIIVLPNPTQTMKAFIFSTFASIGMFAIGYSILLGIIKPDQILERYFAKTGEAYLSASENMVILK